MNQPDVVMSNASNALQGTVELPPIVSSWQTAPLDIMELICDRLTCFYDSERTIIRSPFDTSAHYIKYCKDQDDDEIKLRIKLRSISRAFYTGAEKKRYEIIVLRNGGAWKSLAESLKSCGSLVRRLEIVVSDVHQLAPDRISALLQILSRSTNLRNLSLVFRHADALVSDDSPESSIMRAIVEASGNTLQTFHCELGPRFYDKIVLESFSSFPNLLSGSTSRAFSVPHHQVSRKINAHKLQRLTITSSGDECLDCISDWDLASIRALSIGRVNCAHELSNFFSVRGSQLTALDLGAIKMADIGRYNLFDNLPNLEDLVLSFVGIPTLVDFWGQFVDSPIIRLGLKDFGTDYNLIQSRMAGLDIVMSYALLRDRFPFLNVVKLLDFKLEHFGEVEWKVEYVSRWSDWERDCAACRLSFLDMNGTPILFERRIHDINLLDSE